MKFVVVIRDRSPYVFTDDPAPQVAFVFAEDPDERDPDDPLYHVIPPDPGDTLHPLDQLPVWFGGEDYGAQLVKDVQRVWAGKPAEPPLKRHVYPDA